ncbi:hypothetical protein T281_00840 [Rhodomicrobium udaipurense JA643]|uniref:Uncharacterized protein n=1 Tax=Rhodomicrobium udaipurense TaxID=1202716 RepID=A0A8I1GF05_9HYPH|nr:hypothetical protein [Rhodomicrobium udaipurense]KAI96364.1 hypothetical protein T281_00840 [Rhodomicrobium udaipurense JA643]MBJ7542496.1 hypothetical protein [Rhodomicrobium udaipurense]
MKYSPASMSALSLGLLSTVALWLVIQQHPVPVSLALILGLFFALLLPAVFMIVRHQTRLDRLRTAGLIRETLHPGPRTDLYFEFLKRKYVTREDDEAQASQAAPAHAVPAPYPFTTLHDWLIALACLPFVLFTAAGFFVLFLPAGQLPDILGGSLGANVFSIGGLSAPSPKDYENVVTIASLAFAGAYLYSVRLFIKSLISFDFSVITPLRAFFHILFAVMLAVVIWRVAPETKTVTSMLSTSSQQVKAEQKTQAAAEATAIQELPAPPSLPKIWLLFAFAIGFVPDAAFTWAARKARLTLDRRYSGSKHNAITPLTVIDGIDFMTSYRLEERRIANVQNLATANPIMLHVETPFCVFIIMDWIAQAQLCAAVGPQRFLLLRKLNLRTIFDLEHAVLDPAAPMGLKHMVGSVLLANDGKTNIMRDFGIRPLDATYRDFDKALSSWVNIEVIEHLVRVILDDLHVQRLRQVWQDIEASMHIEPRAEQPRPQLKIPASAPPPRANGHANGSGNDREYSRVSE